MISLRRRLRLLLLLSCSLHTSCDGFLYMQRSSSSSGGARGCARQQAHDRPPRPWRSPFSHSFEPQPLWVTARGGGSRGEPPPLAVGADSGEQTAGPRKESAHLKLRTMGQGTKRAPAAASAAPWRWVVVEEKEEERDGVQVAPTAGESTISAEGIGTAVEVAAAGSTSETPPKSAAAGGSGGESDGGAAAGEEDRLPPGKARLLEYRAPSGAAGEGDRGETRYASLGGDASKFIAFLESPVARGGRDGDGGGDGDGDVRATGAGAGPAAGPVATGTGTERRIFASTVEVGEEGVQRSLQALWKDGRLLSQERDAMNVLRGREQNFSELLASYTNRTKSNHWEEISPERLLGTLEAGYGPDARSLCGYDPARPADETLSSIKGVLEWFRKEFPYYYDGCHSCGNGGNNTFVGYVAPTMKEREFRAGRTEVYHCSTCGSVSRFARYVAVSKVLETRRGRCGEYSVLMMRLLEALGYSCRWVVDWSDHVWVEARVAEKWVHIDPCEAAVDEPLLYESWGKNQTYILAFSSTEVVDVTEHYTSDYEAAKARRDVGQDTIAKLLADATKILQGPKL